MGDLLQTLSTIDSRWWLIAFLGVLDIWAIGLVAGSRASSREKLLWSGVILLCPIVGCLLWYVLGPKPQFSRPRHGP